MQHYITNDEDKKNVSELALHNMKVAVSFNNTMEFIGSVKLWLTENYGSTLSDLDNVLRERQYNFCILADKQQISYVANSGKYNFYSILFPYNKMKYLLCVSLYGTNDTALKQQNLNISENNKLLLDCGIAIPKSEFNHVDQIIDFLSTTKTSKGRYKLVC